MAIKGLTDLLAKYKKGELDDAKFEEEFGKTLAGDYIPKGKFNELSESKKVVDKALEDANKTLEELKKNAGLSDEYKKQIDELKAANGKAQEEYKAQLKQLKLDTAIDNALTAAKARNAKAVKALLDTGKIVMTDDGTVAGIKEQLDSIVKENPYLFDTDSGNDDNNPKFGSNNHRGAGGSLGGSDALQAAMMAAAGLSSQS